MNNQLSPFELPEVISQSAEVFLHRLALHLQIPPSAYEEAENRYRSVAEWLRRPESILSGNDPNVYSQGSFALGTVIKPLKEEDEYDVDMICTFNIDRKSVTQQMLKMALRGELSGYAKRHSMNEEPEKHRRCERLIYSADARFHLDVTPSVPNGEQGQLLLEVARLRSEWIADAIAITDEEHRNFNTATFDWPRSNPMGFRKWFHFQMKEAFEKRRQAIALKEGRLNIEEIPDYKVKTPLQYAIQILKRHRDMTHEGVSEDKPISIIISTLAAHAYGGEETISGALYAILAHMEEYIEERNGESWIANPADPLENFADKWETYPERKVKFFSWLAKAKSDFGSVATMNNPEEIAEFIAPSMGRQLAESAFNEASGSSPHSLSTKKLWSLLDPAHRQQPPWTQVTKGGSVSIKSAQFLRKGFRWQEFENNAPALVKGCGLEFKASTTVPQPFDVYWQVVNTGGEARRANKLRGGFEPGKIEHGKLERREDSQYKGTHSIECFIVKNELCVARSGQFVVNIQ